MKNFDIGDNLKMLVQFLDIGANRIAYELLYESYTIRIIVLLSIVLGFCIDLSVTISTKIELLFGE